MRTTGFPVIVLSNEDIIYLFIHLLIILTDRVNATGTSLRNYYDPCIIRKVHGIIFNLSSSVYKEEQLITNLR